MADLIKEELQKFTTEIKAENDILEIIVTPEQPQPQITTHDIIAVKAEIDKIDNAIQSWMDLRKPLQDIVDLYEANLKTDENISDNI